MLARSRTVALAVTLALAVPTVAVAQSGGGGAGDSQYQDPFGSSTQSKPTTPATPATPKAPAAQQAPVQPQTTPAPPVNEPALGTSQPEIQRDPGAQSLPRTGFDVLPVAAIGVVLLLGGLALWRRPHADR